MQATIKRVFHEHQCINPECRNVYNSYDLEAGLCSACKNPRKQEEKRRAVAWANKLADQKARDKEAFDLVLIQTELLPVADILITKLANENVHVKQLATELGFADELYEKISGLVKAMPLGMRITTRILRKMLEIEPNKHGMILFVHKTLDRATREGLLKVVGTMGHGAKVYQKAVPPAHDAIMELQETLEGM